MAVCQAVDAASSSSCALYGFFMVATKYNLFSFNNLSFRLLLTPCKHKLVCFVARKLATHALVSGKSGT